VGAAALVVDAGPLVAYVDSGEPHHSECRELLETHRGRLVVPMLVVAEAAYLLESRGPVDSEAFFLGDLMRGTLSPEPVHAADWERMIQLVARYRDLPLGTVDASLVAAAERLGVTKIGTLDRRYFSVVEPQHVEAFELLP
jgi:predicted nucleic acid-binding protein